MKKPPTKRNPSKVQQQPGHESAFWKNLGKCAVLVGMGNPMRGDDGAAPALIQRLAGQCDCTCINAETAPENYLGHILKQRPDSVLFIDAVDMQRQPGEWCVLEERDLAKTSFHTHAISLRLLLEFLRSQIRARILVLGIQPRHIAFGQGLSAEVEAAIEEIAQTVCTARA